MAYEKHLITINLLYAVLKEKSVNRDAARVASITLKRQKLPINTNNTPGNPCPIVHHIWERGRLARRIGCHNTSPHTLVFLHVRKGCQRIHLWDRERLARRIGCHSTS
jgi:hypothetical protein